MKNTFHLYDYQLTKSGWFRIKGYGIFWCWGNGFCFFTDMKWMNRPYIKINKLKIGLTKTK